MKLSASGMKHLDCGGMIIIIDGGIRLECGKCGEIETWEDAAKRWNKAYQEAFGAKLGLEQIEDDFRAFVRRLGMGHLLR